MPQISAHIGFTTTVLEAAATSIGAGMLIGGFVFGAVRLVLKWPSEKLEKWALGDGYFGGLFAVALLIFDLLMRYIV